ncbi:hypothetical protein ACLI09_06885 [Flavobacterium sp. RHBU_24]|uniref:hypothetical protein n=1 Tax=Flavobacterium sp. RHBU_24 TaxID=3391185 RepID=UPI003984673D
MNPLKISIPTPCHESWDAMTPEGKGRFCDACAKTVVDFTGMKALEITDYFSTNSSKKVCGRFKGNQLENKVEPVIPTALLNKIAATTLNFRQMFAVTLMAVMGTSLFSCNKEEPEATVPDPINQKAQKNRPTMYLGAVDVEYDTLDAHNYIPRALPGDSTASLPVEKLITDPSN